jgi:hypothetical protein
MMRDMGDDLDAKSFKPKVAAAHDPRGGALESPEANSPPAPLNTY